jgi:7-cyano-7-deazaguanine synthase
VSGAVVILSGGLDSTVCIAEAVTSFDPVIALTVDYGQRHRIELERAGAVASHYGVEHIVQRLDLSAWGGSALTDPSLAVPTAAEAAAGSGIPITYVPGRNLIFLSLAVALAEARECDTVFIGVNALDYSGYPDCRAPFLRAFEAAATRGTSLGARGLRLRVLAPLVRLDKKGVVRLAEKVGAPLRLTWSCYAGGRRPCGTCDSCKLRAKGFREAGREDPAA